MRKILFIMMLGAIALANRYDYLLFSNNYTDVRKGIELGANVNATLRGSTPLYDASRKNNMEILYLLINRGARVNAISHGETPLHKVVQFGNYRFAEALLKAGAKPNIKDTIRGNTALHYAVSRNDKAMISLLMSHGADMYIANDNGDTPARFVLARVQIPAMQVQNKYLSIASSAFSIGQGAVGLSGLYGGAGGQIRSRPLAAALGPLDPGSDPGLNPAKLAVPRLFCEKQPGSICFQ